MIATHSPPRAQFQAARISAEGCGLSPRPAAKNSPNIRFFEPRIR